MTILTKNYRLIWSENNILHDPFMEFGNSKTFVNTNSCFESDDIQEIQDKINELSLIYNNDEDVLEIDDDINEENYIDFDEIIE